ncbi:hypothetical protein F7R91_39340 [Streptomyces luteolifulvus]|uniref:Uncharacterized protein n=1 Tax=Streptomyces luteolifulvus TaxID=2615112 RepID=A0A6H9UP48_9ACTN|nr:hypothetical protein [Streptomyces luteolifulvus]KAB1139559.1 hypothetical protein F7R91_39340 [Streptomyces luteolifulvus]
MSTVSPPEQPDESSIPDEQWDSFLRDAVEGDGKSAAPKEPSARARMVARRLREQDEDAAGGGRRRWGRKTVPEPQAWTPSGWRTGPAWQEMNGKVARRRKAASVVGVLLAVGLAVVAVRPSLVLDRIQGRESGGTGAVASPSPLPAETALPTAGPGEVEQYALPTREQPFLGSPAAQWADGADAIELPATKAVPGMSREDVALALRRTKEFLVAANLDPAVLRGGQPDKALALLDPKQSDVVSDVRRSLRKPTHENEPIRFFSRFDPDEVVLAGEVVKVRGHMTFEAARRGEVRVHADYSFVYPVVRAHGDSDVVARTIIRRYLTVTVADPRQWLATEDKLWLEAWDASYGNDDCGVDDGYFHPSFPDETATGAPPTGPAEDPYDRSRSLNDDSGVEGEECGVVSRT